jgi:hypothetical protein
LPRLMLSLAKSSDRDLARDTSVKSTENRHQNCRIDSQRVRDALNNLRRISHSPRNEQHWVFKNNVSPLKSGGREGIRTPDLLIANEEKSKLRLGATVT